MLSATGTGGVGEHGIQPRTTLTITGSLEQVNTDLATLKRHGQHGTARHPDTITLNATDSFGNIATQQTIEVTVNGVPAITAPTPSRRSGSIRRRRSPASA